MKGNVECIDGNEGIDELCCYRVQSVRQWMVMWEGKGTRAMSSQPTYEDNEAIKFFVMCFISKINRIGL